jgi:hypothetical protein
MGKHELKRREYGARYYETRAIADLGVLAERILVDLPLYGSEGLLFGAECSIHVLVGVVLQAQIGRLPDEFAFSGRATHRYSREGVGLIVSLTRFMESYNWTNPDDPTDRRFFTSVYLLAESEYRSGYWSPDVITVF